MDQALVVDRNRASSPPDQAARLATLPYNGGLMRGYQMNETKAFAVELEITRTVTVVIEAKDALQAREKANNLEFKHEIVGEITHWVVRTVVKAS